MKVRIVVCCTSATGTPSPKNLKKPLTTASSALYSCPPVLLPSAPVSTASARADPVRPRCRHLLCVPLHSYSLYVQIFTVTFGKSDCHIIKYRSNSYTYFWMITQKWRVISDTLGNTDPRGPVHRRPELRETITQSIWSLAPIRDVSPQKDSARKGTRNG